jgi:fructose-1,6-bisphosphatase II
VVAVAERGSLYYPPEIYYMDKLAVGEGAAGAIDINAPVADNIHNVARALGKKVQDITVVILDRPRNKEYIQQVRATGARIKMILHGDVSAGVMTTIENPPADILMGIGGSPEAVLTACALKCTGGEIQCKLWPRNDDERAKAQANGLDLDKVLHTNDLVRGENIFFAATGITSGEFLRGVQYLKGGALTHSVVMRSASGTTRYIESHHRWNKLMRIADQPYTEAAQDQE